MKWIRQGKIDIACGHDIYIDMKPNFFTTYHNSIR